MKYIIAVIFCFVFLSIGQQGIYAVNGIDNIQMTDRNVCPPFCMPDERQNNLRGNGNITETDYPGDTAIDVTYYRLELGLTVNPNGLTGAVTITGKAVGNISSYYLDLVNNMTVDSVTDGSSSALSFTHSNNKLNITPLQPLQAGTPFTAMVYYHGVPGQSGLGSFVFGQNQGSPVIWTLSESYGAKEWFPNKDYPGDKADSSDMIVTVADNFTAVSNGVLLATVSNSNGTHTFKWKEKHPIAPYLISLAIAEYTVYKNYFRYSPTDSMEVVHYLYPQHANLTPLLDLTPGMLDYFSKTFGLYPFIDEKYGHADFQFSGGMEHQSISSIGYWSEAVLAHELTHQWFGDKITCDDWHHIWLNEGFATFGELLWNEHTRGADYYKDQVRALMASARTAHGTIWVQDITNEDEIFDGARTYNKGGIVLHMLRGVLGDSLFFTAIRSYVADPRFAYSSATTEGFQSVCESVSGQSLGYFFNEWIYGENYPRYVVNWRNAEAGSNDYTVTVNVSQQTNTSPSFFTMPVQMRIQTAITDTLVTVLNNSPNQDFVFTLRGKPFALEFDPDNLILKDVSGNIANAPVMYQLDQNFPNPFNPATTIGYELAKPSFVKLKVYDTLGKQVASLVNERQRDGRYSVPFNAGRLPSGVYYYKLTILDDKGLEILFEDTKKMVVVK